MVLVTVGACGGSTTAAPARVPWQPVALPAPPGGGHPEPAAVSAGPPWLIGGAIQQPDQAEPIPAVWSSADGRTWQARIMQPRTPDGVHTRILSVAVHGTVQVALGNRPSPLHGNPRPTVWRAVGDGPFAEIPITRELFGGPDLVSFGSVSASAQGFFVAGAWSAPAGMSATVWFSPDGLAWTRVDSAAAFAPAGASLVEGIAASSSTGEVVVAGRTIGGSGGSAGALRPAAWRAPRVTGPWTAIALGPSRQMGTVDAVAMVGEVAVGAGWTGASRLTVWMVSASGGWRTNAPPGHPAAPGPGQDEAGIVLTTAGPAAALLSVSGPGGNALWKIRISPLHWSRLAVPAGEKQVSALPVASDGQSALALDPASGSIWLAALPVA